MDLRIAVLAGDGIGPEIMEQGVGVLTAIAEKYGHNVTYKEALCGAHAIDEVGDPFPEETGYARSQMLYFSLLSATLSSTTTLQQR